MCSTNHDATCTAVLSRSLTRPGQLVATLVCERCGETLKVLGVYEHHVVPVLVDPAPELEAAACQTAA